MFAKALFGAPTPHLREALSCAQVLTSKKENGFEKMTRSY